MISESFQINSLVGLPDILSHGIRLQINKFNEVFLAFSSLPTIIIIINVNKAF